VIREDEATDGTRLFLAEIPELPGCQAHGMTPEEALRNVEEAAELYLETAGAAPLAPPIAATATMGTSMLAPSVVGEVVDVESDVTLERVA
jgi:predicted RNase H-like HicB family nuclease